MPTLARGMQFTENEWAYCLWHRGWRPAPVPTPLNAPSLWVRLGLDTAESQRTSDAYLERRKNSVGGPADVGPYPACKCIGYDCGVSMFSERIGPAADLPDAFILFDWWEAAGMTFDFATRVSPSNPFWPWAAPRYPNASRNDTSLDIAGIAARVGPNPYALERSPYWRMKALGVPVHDLPVPPRALWVSPLPAAPLSQGQSGTPTSPLGIAINTLCHRLLFEDCWVTKTGAPAGTPTWYYGSDWVRSSLVKHQTRMAGFGLWDGPIDGSKFTAEYRAVWDGALRYGHEIGAN